MGVSKCKKLLQTAINQITTDEYSAIGCASMRKKHRDTVSNLLSKLDNFTYTEVCTLVQFDFAMGQSLFFRNSHEYNFAALTLISNIFSLIFIISYSISDVTLVNNHHSHRKYQLNSLKA